MTVVILEDAAQDLESGAQFYEARAQWELAIIFSTQSSPILTLILFAGVQFTLDSIGCCQSDSHSASIMRWKTA
jgi:hypothetical protein